MSFGYDYSNGTSLEQQEDSSGEWGTVRALRWWKVGVLSAMVAATAASNAASLAALCANSGAGGRRRRMLRRHRQQQRQQRRRLRKRSDCTCGGKISSSALAAPLALAAAPAAAAAANPASASSSSSLPSSPSSRMYFFLFHLSVADALTAPLTLLPELLWTLAAIRREVKWTAIPISQVFFVSPKKICIAKLRKSAGKCIFFDAANNGKS